jgi:hypothetical protein
MPKTDRDVHELTKAYVEKRIGLLRNNRQRRKEPTEPMLRGIDGRAVVVFDPKAWKVNGMSRKDLRAFLAEGTFDRDFKSGRKITLKLKG